MTEAPRRPLAGRTILVTRPAHQAEGLRALLEAAGGRVLLCPLLEIAPVAEPDYRAAARLLARREHWDWLVFVSANAVRHALAIPGWRDADCRRPRIAAVGAATARALEQAGIPVDLIPKPQFNSESLLAAPEMADGAGRRLLVVRGVGGREHLAEVMRQRGAEVVHAELYRRIPAGPEAGAAIESWRQSGMDAVVVTSGEALGHLLELLGEAGAEWALRTPLVVIGARIAALAGARGWDPIAVAAEASDQGLADAVIGLCREPAGRSGMAGPAQVSAFESMAHS